VIVVLVHGVVLPLSETPEDEMGKARELLSDGQAQDEELIGKTDAELPNTLELMAAASEDEGMAEELDPP
jgi:hypothetical protein